MIKVTEVIRANPKGEYYLREAMVNSKQIVSVSLNDEFIVLLHQGMLPDGLDNAHEFADVSLSNGKTMVVVGSPKSISEKMRTSKNILHG